MSDSIDSALVLRALCMAVLHRHPPANLLFHSDRGVQYAAGNFRAALRTARLLPSMSRRGSRYDHTFMESFWSTLKLELVYRWSNPTSSHQSGANHSLSESSSNP